MADAKISQLPVASTPLAGTELVPVVQGGATEQTTVEAILTGTVPSGTANGVLYLNGSKVVTSGSALTFNGTTLVAGAASARIQVSPATNTNNSLFQATNAGGSGYFGLDSSTGALSGTAYALALWHNSNYSIVFGVNNTEKMRLDSTGLGIGTNNPIEKLTVSGSAAFSRIGLNANAIDIVSTAQSFARFQTTGGDFYVGTESGTGGGFFPGSTAYAAVLYNASSTPMQFYTAGTLRATLDSSGNLGLGVTPSAWTSYKAIQLSGSAYLYGFGNDELGLGQGAYYSSGWKYAATGVPATWYSTYRGTHIWQTAASWDGTGSDAISFTQAMTLDASGNLLINTTSSNSLPGDGYVFTKSTSTQYTGHASGTASGTGYQQFWYDGASIGSITQDGTTGVLYNLTSDRRLKQNIVPAPSASAVIDAIQIVSHGWKSAPNEHVTYGVIAQDLHAVAPQAVSVGDDGDEIEKAWGVDYSKLVPMLIKEIQSLRARLAAAGI